MVWKAGLAGAVTALACGTAAAQMVDPANPQSVVGALQQFGYRATLEAASDGDPKIRTAIEGTNYNIWFYGCAKGADCRQLLFSVGFNLEKPLDMGVVNTWNHDRLVGRAYLDDEGDPYLDYYIEARGGISPVVFEQTLTSWGKALADFKVAIGW